MVRDHLMQVISITYFLISTLVILKLSSRMGAIARRPVVFMHLVFLVLSIVMKETIVKIIWILFIGLSEVALAITVIALVLALFVRLVLGPIVGLFRKLYRQ